MPKKFDERKLDRRIVEKFITRGTVAKADYDDFIKSLPDESANVEYMKAFTEEDEGLTFSSVEEVK